MALQHRADDHINKIDQVHAAVSYLAFIAVISGLVICYLDRWYRTV